MVLGGYEIKNGSKVIVSYDQNKNMIANIYSKVDSELLKTIQITNEELEKIRQINKLKEQRLRDIQQVNENCKKAWSQPDCQEIGE